ncbi:WhiB family transcriptional regulator [Streptomyces sp. NPDC046984]|uniref:WhiB family transcriptional regulator n=1 Tax=Streptomyces sp. NPDC046984 TaxID=3155138 RepID=UPI0033CDAD2F
MSTQVLDKISEGHDVIARANRLAQEGTTLAHREASAIRDVYVMETEELTGDTVTVRMRACPACGCFTLLPYKGKAQCISRHCAPRPGLRRRWTYQELAYTKPGTPRGIQRSDGYPADLRSLAFLTDFFAESGNQVPLSTMQNWVRLHNLPTHKVDGQRALLYSLSDVATVHAAQLAARQGATCADTARPACVGLADLFYNTDDQAPAMDQRLVRRRIEVAKQLCAACPFREPCLEVAMQPNDKEQHGVAGGLTRTERRALKGKPR